MNHKELKAWQMSMQLVSDIYILTHAFPKSELFGLTGQIRRSAISIPSNIAEGAGRGSTKEYIRFLNIAIGSISELETQIQIALNLKYFDNHDLLQRISEVRKLTIGIKKSLLKKL